MSDSLQGKFTSLPKWLAALLPFLGSLAALMLLIVLGVVSIILRKPPESPKAAELLAMIETQGSSSAAWDFSLSESDPFVFERVPYETRVASFSADSVTLRLKESLVEPISFSQVLAVANTSVTLPEINALNALNATLAAPALATYVDQSQMPAFVDFWTDVTFLSEVHAVDQSIEFSISGNAYWGDNYIYSGMRAIEGGQRDAQWFFTSRSEDGERSKAPQVDGLGDLVGSIFAKVFPTSQKSNVILSRPNLSLKADDFGILNRYNLNWIAYETNAKRESSQQSLKPLSDYKKVSDSKVWLLNLRQLESLRPLQSQFEQTRAQKRTLVDYARKVSDRLAEDVASEYEAAQETSNRLEARLSGVDRFGFLSEKTTGRESIVILSPDPSVSRPVGFNAHLIELYGDFANRPVSLDRGSLSDLQPEFAELYELLRFVELPIGRLSNSGVEDELNYKAYLNDPKRGYQMQLKLPSITQAGEGQVLDFTTISDSGSFELAKPLGAEGFELNLSEEVAFTATIESKIDEISAIIATESAELAALEDRKAKLLGPVNLGNILQGEVVEKNGAKSQKAWVEVVEIRESASGPEGLFDLAMSFRAPEDPSVQLIAKGTIDMRSDSEGIVSAFIRKAKQVADLERSKQMLEGLLHPEREVVSVNNVESLVQEEVWNPSDTDYAITLVPERKDAQVLQNVRIVGQSDKRILLSVEPTALQGESQSANLSLDAVDGAFMERYHAEMSAIRESTPISTVFADTSKRYTFDLTGSSTVGTTLIVKGWAYDSSRAAGAAMTGYAAPSLRGKALQSILVTDVFSAGSNEDWMLENRRWQRSGAGGYFEVDRLLTDFQNKRGTGLYSLNRTTNRPVLLARSALIDGKKDKTLLDTVGDLGAVAALGGKLIGNEDVVTGGASAMAVSGMQGEERDMEYRVATDPTQLSLGLSERIFFVADGNPMAALKLFNVKGGSFFSSNSYKLLDESNLLSVRQWSSRVFEITLPSKAGKYVLTRGNLRSGNAGVIIELK